MHENWWICTKITATISGVIRKTNCGRRFTLLDLLVAGILQRGQNEEAFLKKNHRYLWSQSLLPRCQDNAGLMRKISTLGRGLCIARNNGVFILWYVNICGISFVSCFPRAFVVLCRAMSCSSFSRCRGFAASWQPRGGKRWPVLVVMTGSWDNSFWKISEDF